MFRKFKSIFSILSGNLFKFHISQLWQTMSCTQFDGLFNFQLDNPLSFWVVGAGTHFLENVQILVDKWLFVWWTFDVEDGWSTVAFESFEFTYF